jgi:hypothetical protein
MDKLERYLDQVCRSMGGPWSMRQHVRQELREHLLDAMAQHKAAGLSEEAALDRALADFGGPEEMRAELEATHGHRLMPVLIDKAMQWKERTMKAKWLWTTWAYLAASGVIVLEALLITFIVIFIIPRFQLLLRVGMIESTVLEEHGLMWMPAFLRGVSAVGGGYTTWLLLAAIAAIALFEWRVKSENKPFMRLAALGTAGVALMVVVMIAVASLVISFTLAMPPLGQMTRPFAVEQVTSIDNSIGRIEQALAKKDWAGMREQAEQATSALNRLTEGPALMSLTRWNEAPTLEELRAHVQSASDALRAAGQAIDAKDAGRLEPELARLRKAIEPVREAAKRAGR